MLNVEKEPFNTYYEHVCGGCGFFFLVRSDEGQRALSCPHCLRPTAINGECNLEIKEVKVE